MATIEETFPLGNLVTYEYFSANDGRKYVCKIIGYRDGWVLDENSGTCFSSSFRPENAIIWENRKDKKK